MSVLPFERPGSDARRATLDIFARTIRIPRISRIVQRGREPETARYTIELDDGRSVRVGTIKTLWSQVEMGKVLAVTIGCVPPTIEPKEWRKNISAVINHALDVDETPGETFADMVRDWLGAYAARAGTDINGALASGRPFFERDAATGAENLYVQVKDLATYIRRHYSAAVKEAELRLALGDLGFVRLTRPYTQGSKRSTTSCYWAPIDVLDPGETL